MRMHARVLPAVVAAAALSVLILGCSGGDDKGTVAEPVLTRIVEGEITPVIGPSGTTADEPPGTTATSGGSTVEMGIGTYCWTTMCADMIGPITRGALEIAPGDEVTVVIPDGTPPLREVSVVAYPAAEPQALDNGATAWRPDFENSVTLTSTRDAAEVRIVAALEAGTYVLTVGMYFEPGDVSYGVVLEVK